MDLERCLCAWTKSMEPTQRSHLNGVWHHDGRYSLVLDLDCEREAQAEAKIWQLLMHSARKRESAERDKSRPRSLTDAEIIFGDCDCKKVLCDGIPCSCGWEKSRIDWLWKLERRQQELHESWRRQSSRRRPSSKSSTPKPTLLKSPVDAPKRRNSCWKWLRRTCKCVSDTESLDVPFRGCSSV